MGIFIEPEFTEYYRKNPIVLVDIGASGGLEPNWQLAKNYLQIIGFEPDEREFSNLEKKANREGNNVKYINTGLYKNKTSIDFFLTANQQNSSMFKPNRKFIDKFSEKGRFDIIKTVKINTDSLDNQFKTHNINDADFIKIDTQGSELFILEGAEETIRNNIFGLEIEVEFVEIYKDQPLFAEIDSYVRKQGFQLFDIQGSYWKREIGKSYGRKKGQLMFGNALYFKKTEDFVNVIDGIQDKYAKKTKVLKAVSICLLYGYIDYALELFYMIHTVFDKHERQIIEKMIKRNVRYESKIPHFKGKHLIASIFNYFYEVWKPTHDRWATVDRKLGNL